MKSNTKFEKPQNLKATAKRLANRIGKYKIGILISLILVVFGTAFSVVSPYILGLATTSLFTEATVNFKYILTIIVVLLVIYVLSSLFTYLQQFIMAKITKSVIYKLREDVQDKISRLPLKYFDNITTGEILSRVTSDIDTISQTMNQSMAQILSSVSAMVGILAIMIYINGFLTVATILTVPLSFLITALIIPKSQKYIKEQLKHTAFLNGTIEETYSGHEVVKAFSSEANSEKIFKEHNDNVYKNAVRGQFISGLLMPLMMFVSNLGYVVVAITGGFLAIKGQLSVGNIQAFIMYSKQFTQPIVQIANIMSTIQSAFAASERVFLLLDEEELITDEKDIPFNPKGDIDFKHVNFGYTKTLINDLNLHVPSGSKVAIVGPTGAGKTTLVNLLLRFYETDSGSIEIGGVKTTDMKRESLRKAFAMVLQDTWMFEGTVLENIGYSNESASREEIIEASKMAHSHHFINALENGYDKILEEDSLSSGQKQLITIARAILADPDILILDEATSSVDTRTEAYIQSAMVNLMKDRTSFVIAHRLSTIRDADIIIVMKDGDVIENGNHKSLMEQNGFYASLYNSQFANS